MENFGDCRLLFEPKASKGKVRLCAYATSNREKWKVFFKEHGLLSNDVINRNKDGDSGVVRESFMILGDDWEGVKTQVHDECANISNSVKAMCPSGGDFHGRNCRGLKGGMVKLDKKIREAVLRAFSARGSRWVETLAEKKEDNGRDWVRIRKVAGIDFRLTFKSTQTLLTCESNEKSFADSAVGIRESLEKGNLNGESCRLQEGTKVAKIAVAYKAAICKEDGTVNDELVGWMQSDYEKILSAIRDRALYFERQDPEARQFVAPEECAQDIKELGASLIFAMSHGSHELFHSNIWAWLINKGQAFVKVFFPDLKGRFLRVKREEGNRDLTIWMENADGKEKAYVVENKFKSFPRKGQLLDYQEGLNDKFAEGLLVALNVPDEFDSDAWHVCTQVEICKRMEDVLKESALSDQERGTIADYIAMTRKMSKVLSAYLEKLGDRWSLALCRDRGETEAVGDLESIKLGDVFKKINASRLVAYLEGLNEIHALRQEIRNFKSGFELEISHDFLHKLPVLNCEIVRRYDPGDLKKKIAIGVMLQGHSFARCACSFDKVRFRSAETLYRALKLGGRWFDDKSFLLPGLRLMSQRKEYKQYVTNDYTVTYQDIGLVCDTFAWIAQEVVEQLNHIVDLLHDGSLNAFFASPEVTENEGTVT